jgi:type II secretory ATPase GspE/PulE/Tfp pilus assembly ATPase PilB-like protein
VQARRLFRARREEDDARHDPIHEEWTGAQRERRVLEPACADTVAWPARTDTDRRSMSQARFQKQMREKARREKALAKQERKEERAAEAASAETGDAAAAPQPQVLEQLAELHRRFDADDIDFEEFEERKTELLGQLDV